MCAVDLQCARAEKGGKLWNRQPVLNRAVCDAQHLGNFTGPQSVNSPTVAYVDVVPYYTAIFGTTSAEKSGRYEPEGHSKRGGVNSVALRQGLCEAEMTRPLLGCPAGQDTGRS